MFVQPPRRRDDPMGLVICQTMGRWQLENWHGCSPAARNSCGREGARETEQLEVRLSLTAASNTPPLHHANKRHFDFDYGSSRHSSLGKTTHLTHTTDRKPQGDKSTTMFFTMYR